MRLFRLHSLASENHTNWVIDTINSSSFHCSSFAAFNDPMEGVFRTNSITDLENLTSQKNKFKACCFTDIYGVKNPALWGYYAGSFRGVAFEVLPANDHIYKIDYANEIPSIPDTDDESLKKALTTKLKPWKHEREFRFINKTEEEKNKIGEIVALHCFIPYSEVENRDQIHKSSDSIQSYLKNLSRLESEVGENTPIYVAGYDHRMNRIKLTKNHLRHNNACERDAEFASLSQHPST